MSGSSSGADLDRAGLLRRWPTAVALIAMWIALWGRLSVANVLSGALVAWAVLLLARGVTPRPVQRFRIGGALRYLITFLRQLVMANYQVALAVLRPTRIVPGIIAVPLRHASDAVVTLVANSITLTPGTLTLETERRGDTAILYVHTLDVSDIEGVRGDIRLLETLALAAFGQPDAQIAQVDRRVEAAPGTAARDVEAVDRNSGDQGRRNEGKETT